MKPIVFLLTEQKLLAEALIQECDYDQGDLSVHQFPDEEIRITINSPVKNRHTIIILGLEKPNDKISLLLLVTETLRELGATKIGLIAPYLSYMRQDTQFNLGEGVSAKYFARFLSHYVDWLITIDPHLHRYHHLSAIYSIPATVLHSTRIIANWIKKHIEKPLLIGPDEESLQWVSDLGERIKAPVIVLSKERKGDRDVRITLPSLTDYSQCTPVLMDDIISTAKTMVAAVESLRTLLSNPPVCVGVHGIFADDAYELLLKAGVKQIVTCNTIIHPTNEIDINPEIINWFKCNRDGLLTMDVS